MVAEPKRMARRVPVAALALAAVLVAGEAAGAEGRLEWARRVTLGFAVGGVVERVAVRPGDRVRAGALLARLDTRPFDARVRELAARAEALVPELEEARRERDRTEALYERAVIAEHERQLAHIAYVRAEAALRAARAALARARIEREYAELRAPFDGVVLAVHAAPGQAVAAGLRVEPVVELAPSGRLAARVRLARAPPLGGAATVRARGRALPGRVEALAAVDGGWEARVVFALPEGVALEPGMAVEVELP